MGDSNIQAQYPELAAIHQIGPLTFGTPKAYSDDPPPNNKSTNTLDSVCKLPTCGHSSGHRDISLENLLLRPYRR